MVICLQYNKISNMNTFRVQETSLTPNIDFNALNGEMSIKGKSVFFTNTTFWEDVISWYKTYLLNPKEKTVLHIDLEHFNSLSAKFLFYFLKMSKYLVKNGFIIQINWSVSSDDQDMIDTVTLMKQECGLPIQIMLK